MGGRNEGVGGVGGGDEGGAGEGERSSVVGRRGLFQSEGGGTVPPLRGAGGGVGVLRMLGQQCSNSLEVSRQGPPPQLPPANASSRSPLSQVQLFLSLNLIQFMIMVMA